MALTVAVAVDGREVEEIPEPDGADPAGYQFLAEFTMFERHFRNTADFCLGRMEAEPIRSLKLLWSTRFSSAVAERDLTLRRIAENPGEGEKMFRSTRVKDIVLAAHLAADNSDVFVRHLEGPDSEPLSVECPNTLRMFIEGHDVMRMLFPTVFPPTLQLQPRD